MLCIFYQKYSQNFIILAIIEYSIGEIRQIKIGFGSDVKIFCFIELSFFLVQMVQLVKLVLIDLKKVCLFYMFFFSFDIFRDCEIVI